jgi:hypothetical protein
MQINPRVFCSLLAAALVLGFVGRTNAGFLNGFSGNTKAENTGLSAKITKNFAVLDRLTGASSTGDVFGTGQTGFDTSMIAGAGSGALDTGARYLYLYQDVASPASLAVFVGDDLSSQGTPLGITSYGQWRLHLADDSGIVSTTNDFGQDGIAFSPGAPANTGVTNPSISSSPPTIGLIQADLSVTSTSFSQQFSLGAGEVERVVGFTSNYIPQFLAFNSESNFAGGALPVPAPEPSSIVLLCAGGLGLVGYFRRRGRV